MNKTLKTTLKTIVLVWAAITIVALYVASTSVASTSVATNNRALTLCQPYLCTSMGAK